MDTDLVECLTIEVSELASLESVGSALAELVDAAAIRILDLVCLRRDLGDANVTVLELDEVESLLTLKGVEGEVGGLLSDHDIELASLTLRPGSSAILLVVEDRWAEPLSTAARRTGGRVLGGQRIPASRVQAALKEPLPGYADQ